MTAVAKAMANPESGLEVRDRMWLKITIPNAFIGKNLLCPAEPQGQWYNMKHRVKADVVSIRLLDKNVVDHLNRGPTNININMSVSQRGIRLVGEVEGVTL